MFQKKKHVDVVVHANSAGSIHRPFGETLDLELTLPGLLELLLVNFVHLLDVLRGLQHLLLQVGQVVKHLDYESTVITANIYKSLPAKLLKLQQLLISYLLLLLLLYYYLL